MQTEEYEYFSKYISMNIRKPINISNTVMMNSHIPRVLIIWF